MEFAHDFQTILGRNLVGELKNFVHRPFLLVTMEDLWPKFAPLLEGAELHRYIVHSVDEKVLLADMEKLPRVEAVVGLGGGMAVDTAKFFAWRKRLPLFQVQTALSMNASWGQRCGVRIDGAVRYIGWAVPEAVYIDYDVLRAAPPQFNWSGIGDILCNLTGVLDWQYATRQGKCEAKWPYDEALARRSLANVQAVVDHADDIHALNDQGIKALVQGLRWGTSYHGAGWNPRHIEGIDHFFFYALEQQTGRKFLHGQPVCLGVVAGCLLHDARAEEMLTTMRRVGLDIRPEAMGVSWDDVSKALRGLRAYVHEQKLWHSIAHDVEIRQDFVDRLRAKVEAAYGAWR